MSKPPCPVCLDARWLCEDHPNAPWGHVIGGRPCIGTGMRCPICNPTADANDPRDLQGFQTPEA